MDKNESGQNKQGGPASPSQGGLSWSTPQNQNQPQKPVQQPKLPVAPAQQNTNAAKYAGMVVVGIVAGVVLAWGWSSWRPSPGATVDNNAATTTSSGSTTTGDNLGVDTSTLPAIGTNSSLNIASPQAAGNSVAVAKAIVSAPTWVVIYEDNNGKPGNALGAALFFPGGQTGTVELLRATMPGKTYLAAEQVDNGDRKFSLKDDQFLTEGGQVQWVTFKTN
jgi:hypothetical protein